MKKVIKKVNSKIANSKRKSFLSFWFCVFMVCSSISTVKAELKPDFAIKGFHLDLKCQVMTMPALRTFAKELSEMGINTLVMEWEGSFPYERNATLSNKYAFTREEVKSFVSYCTSLGIDVIPLQNCFGHVEYILRHSRYASIKEDNKEISQVCPMKEEECKAIFKDIFSDIIELHPSKYLFIGGDETFLLGNCKLCSAKVAKEGKSKLFVDYVKLMCEVARSMGKIPVLWADILLKNPEAASELPKDAIFVDWNYGWDKNHFGNIDNLLQLGFNLWGAAAIRSSPDNLYLTQWDVHFNNISSFIPSSREIGYKGMIMTSWSCGGTYGFTYDAGWEVVNMQQIRNVYPISGFRILVAAYGESLKNTLIPLNQEDFVVGYGQKRFGLTAQESELLWQILKTPQEIIKGKKEKTASEVTQMKEGAIALQKQMSTLKPKTNQKEFEHLRLMLDIRVQYLDFKEIEMRYQSPEFNRNLAKKYVQQLEPLITESKNIDKRFINLNKGFLHDEELLEINHIRNEKLYIMYATVKRLTI